MLANATTGSIVAVVTAGAVSVFTVAMQYRASRATHAAHRAAAAEAAKPAETHAVTDAYQSIVADLRIELIRVATVHAWNMERLETMLNAERIACAAQLETLRLQVGELRLTINTMQGDTK